jgi:hypothetical protein
MTEHTTRQHDAHHGVEPDDADEVTPTELDLFLAQDIDLPGDTTLTPELQAIDRLIFAALGASVTGDDERLFMLLAELRKIHGWPGVGRALHVLGAIAVKPFAHFGVEGCTLVPSFDLEVVEPDERPMWDAAMGVATDVLSGTLANNGVRRATGMGALTEPLVLPVLVIVIRHVHNLLELAAGVQGVAIAAYDALNAGVNAANDTGEEQNR